MILMGKRGVLVFLIVSIFVISFTSAALIDIFKNGMTGNPIKSFDSDSRSIVTSDDLRITGNLTNQTCVTDQDCLDDTLRYCSGDSSCMTSTYYSCNQGYCTRIGGGGGCGFCPNGCLDGYCVEGNETGYCGDGIRQVGEGCDGLDLGGHACQDVEGPYDFIGGNLTCTLNCEYDLSGCIANPNPWCNDTDEGINLENQGYCTDSRGVNIGDGCVEGGLREVFCSNVDGLDICTFDDFECDNCNQGVCLQNQTNSSCTDTDGGMDVGVFGSCSFGPFDPNQDSCDTSQIVMENYCDVNDIGIPICRIHGFYCPFGCSGGVCLPGNETASYCTDTDGGVNYYVRGTANLTSATNITGSAFTDTCIGHGLTEVSCANAPNVAIMFQKYFCPDGCSDGACIQGNQTNSTSCLDSGYQCTSAVRGCGHYSEYDLDCGGLSELTCCEEIPFCGDGVCFAHPEPNYAETPESCPVDCGNQTVICGDVDLNERLNIADITSLVNYLFKNGSAPVSLWAANVNGDERLSVSDILLMVNVMFKGSNETYGCTSVPTNFASSSSDISGWNTDSINKYVSSVSKTKNKPYLVSEKGLIQRIFS